MGCVASEHAMVSYNCSIQTKYHVLHVSGVSISIGCPRPQGDVGNLQGGLLLRIQKET